MIVEYAYMLSGILGGIALILFGLLLRQLRTSPMNKMHPDYENLIQKGTP